MTRFHKMHGLGNDFVIFDAREGAVAMDAARARAIADRRTGVGCDQVILLEPSDVADVQDADLECRRRRGRGLRQCRRAAWSCSRAAARRSRPRAASSSGDAGGVDMGAPRFGWDEIPLAYAMDTARMPVGWEELQEPAAVNVGNPHVVFFVARRRRGRSRRGSGR